MATNADKIAERIRANAKDVNPESPGAYLLALGVVELASEGYTKGVISKLTETAFERMMETGEAVTETIREARQQVRQNANPRIRVKVTYFKVSGKWYADGFYETSHRYFHDLREEALEMFRAHKRPGLADGPLSDFYALVHPQSDDERSVPFLIQPMT